MYYFCTEILLQPYPVLLTLAGLAIINLWLRREATRRRLLLVTAPVVLLILASTPAAMYFALGSLEWSFPERAARPPGAEAIVVLGGYLRVPTETQPRARLGQDSLDRCFHAADLYLQGPPCPVVVSGGRMDLEKPGPTLAKAMAEFLVTQGVAENDLLLEESSRSTSENAAETGKILAARGIRRIVIVTDAIHLRRAVMCFRKQGLDVTASGCGYHAAEFEWSLRQFLPSPSAAQDLGRVLHEWIGILYYRVRGRI